MAYGIRYTAEFDNTANNRYRVEILQKDFSGDAREILLGGVPVKHSWDTDDPKAPIKGSSLIVNFLNPGGEDTDGNFSALVQLFYFAHLPFLTIANTSFIPEVGVPFTVTGHSNPSVNQEWTPTAIIQASFNSWQIYVADGDIVADTFADFATIIGVDIQGSQIPITNFYSEEDDEFKCKFYENNEVRFEGFLVQDDCTELMADYIHEITLSFNDNLGLLKDVAYSADLARIPLLDIISTCIQSTGLELNTFVYANLFETTFTTDDSFLSQTYVDTQTFYKTDTFDNCYSVLTSIFERFNLTLFQALGSWHIVRWDEVRYGDIPYYQYDSAFALQGTGTMSAPFVSGFEQAIYPETGLQRSIFRPYKFDKETFNYVQPKYLLRNFDLQTLGSLITSYTDGSNTNYEYEFTNWSDGGSIPQSDYFIRVIRDTATGDEIERYLVIKGPGDTALNVMSTPFEVEAGDRMEFAFTFRTTTSQTGPGSIVMGVRLFDGTTTRYADENPDVGWKVGVGWNHPLSSGQNTNVNQSVLIDPVPFPYSGLVYLYLPQAVDVPGASDETRIKDIRLTYTPFINDSIKIIGHVHKTEQDKVIKNNEDVEIFIDDSPRNSIIGNLFLASSSGVLQDRTTRWYRLSNPSELFRIGQITTLEQMLWRRTPRAKLEGTFYGILGVSMLAILNNSDLGNELNFLFGSLEIEYKNNNMNCTMWEICQDGETDEDLTADYTFTYLYDSK